MEMKTWIIVLALLGIAAVPLVRGEHEEHESDRGLLGHRKFSSKPYRETEEMLGVPDAPNNRDREIDLELEEMDDESDVDNNQPAGILIRDADMKGSAGILVIQNGPSSLPLMFQLQPVLKDSKGPFVDIVDDEEMDDDPEMDIPEASEEDEIGNGSGVILVTDNRFQPSSALDIGSMEDEEDEDDDEDQGMIPPKRRIQPTVKPKRKQTNQVSNSDEDSTRPSKKRRRPASQPVQKNRKKNQNAVQNKKKKKNKKKNPNRKRKPNNKRKRLQNVPNRKKNTMFDVRKQEVDRRKQLGVNVNKGSASNTVTNTVTTTETGSADDEPNVNYIVINKPEPPATTERPFWDILGRSAGNDDVEDRSFNSRKGFKRRALG